MPQIADLPPIAVPGPARPVIEAWRRICPDPSPEALMFSTFGRGRRKGQAVPRQAKNFLTWRVHPIAERLDIPKHLITFQVMRRSLGTIYQITDRSRTRRAPYAMPASRQPATLYVQVVEENVMRAVNSHVTTVLEGGTPAVERMGLTGRNVKRLPEPLAGSGSNLVKLVKFRRGGLASD